ncbi:putative major facilitator superfamily transporter [Phaeomoniella chlamydospora]|uniref:Putative major facilitator superfamily transporter n=1 Tax=Phaeomoniella chlamydospora TaxID=158046 RepID=A0A0G2FS50_PHACM|nr:putative major facilitator superfamily transporter [Phaeomoniella chlamydospora]
MASTYDPNHPFPIVGTEEAVAQQIFAHSYDENPSTESTSDEKKRDEKTGGPSDVEVVAVGDEDVILESDYTPEEYRKLKRKIDRYLLPLMWFCYGIQQTDKTSLGTQALFGLREDTNLKGQEYQWLTTIFYMTYLVGEFPSNFLLQRWSLGRALSIYMLCWGICFLMLGSPKEVRWLTKEEKRMAAARIVRNKAGRDVTGIKWTWPQVSEAFRDPQLWFSMINAFLSSVPNGGITTFGSLILGSFGFTTLQVLLVGLPYNVVSVSLFIVVGIYSRKVKNRRMYIMAAATIPPCIGFLGMSLLPDSAEMKWTKWGMYLMTVPFVLSLFLAWTLIPSNVAGRTKKTIISSATFLGYCVGNMCGSQIFKSKDAPRYIPGTIGCTICLGAQFILISLWRAYYVWQNKKRDKEVQEMGLSEPEAEKLGREMGERNCTDLENRFFRYTM